VYTVVMVALLDGRGQRTLGTRTVTGDRRGDRRVLPATSIEPFRMRH
jgi:hypothetical protein